MTTDPATLTPPAPAAPAAPPADLIAQAVAAVEANARQTPEAAPITPQAPAAQTSAPTPQAGAGAAPVAPTEPAPELDRYTRLYSSLSDMERENHQLRSQLKQAQSGAADLQALQQLPIGERLKRLGLDHSQVLDDYTSILAAGSPVAPSGQQPAANDPLIAEIRALRAELDGMKNGTREREQAAERARNEQAFQGLLTERASGDADRWATFNRAATAGLRDPAGRTPAELALAIGERMYVHSQGIAPLPEQILDATENYLRQQAQQWSQLSSAAPQPQTSQPPQPVRPQTQQPTATSGSLGAEITADTPAPRELTPQERLKEAERLVRARIAAREQQRGA